MSQNSQFSSSTYIDGSSQPNEQRRVLQSPNQFDESNSNTSNDYSQFAYSRRNSNPLPILHEKSEDNCDDFLTQSTQSKEGIL